MSQPAHATAELAVQSVLVQLIVILVVARGCAWICKRCGQAEVIGEMFAGILLGPSLFGYVAPDAFAYVFASTSTDLLAGLAQMGLVLLMFQIGLELRLEMVAGAKRTVALVGGLSIVIPFAIGSGASVIFYERLAEPRPDQTAFLLIFGLSMSITALPVLGRIFTETGLVGTRAAVIAISAAAINDVVGWCLLSATTLLVAGEFSISWIALRLAAIGGVVVVAAYVVRPGLHRYFDAHFARHERLKHTAISAVLVLVFASAFATSRLGLHALIGGFGLGVVLHQHEPFVLEWKTRVGPLVNTLFLPIFFTYTGLRTEIAGLDCGEIAQCAAIFVLAFSVKYGGAYLGARLAGESSRTSHVLGACMNTRGLMELVVLNIGYELGILSRAMFSQLVYMAVATTVMTTPLVRRYMRAEGLAARSDVR